MSTKAAHTPTPWHIMYPKAFDYKIVESRGDRTIASIDGTYPEFSDCEDHEDRHHADAKLIVTAVNHHQELKDRLESLVKEFRRPDWEIWCDHGVGVCACGVIRLLEDAEETLKKIKP